MTQHHLQLRWQLPEQPKMGQRCLLQHAWACRCRQVSAELALEGLPGGLLAVRCHPHCCCLRSVCSTWPRCRQQ
jgi:hypothetical protein